MAQKIHKGISPIKVPENEKIVSIAFPSEANSITSLDIPETATIDVTVCNDNFINKLQVSYPTSIIKTKGAFSTAFNSAFNTYKYINQ